MKKLFNVLLTVGIFCSMTAQAQKDYVYLDQTDEVTKQAVTANFQKNNSGWNNGRVSLNHSSPFINIARRDLTETLPTSNATDIQIAKEFLKLNAELFGIDSAQLSRLDNTVRGHKVRGSEVRFFSKGLIQYDGYPNLHNFGYHIDILISVRNHQVYRVLNRTDRLKFEKIVSQPKIPAHSNVILDDLIGKDLVYFGVGGDKLSAGKIEALDIEPKGLSMKLLFMRGKSKSRLGLTWHYTITKNSLSWEAFYSAIDGEFLALLPNFAT